ncbi:MAG: N-acetylglucosamine-6-phosphate deacetylase [Lachnospiraceae bacterium]|nr:N-acetylglucosamine-6-phosphate deacetylase [Lachnospiraceae bacterium]
MIIKGARIFTGGSFTETDIRIEGNRIFEIGTNLPRSGPDEEVYDGRGNKLIPGPIDIHTHGRIGYDFTTASESEIHGMLKSYLRAGVTGVFATVMTNDKNILLSAFERLGRIIKEQKESAASGNADRKMQEATIYGINFEGVWLSPNKRGAHLEKYLELPSIATYERYMKASGGNIRLATIAPELEGAIELIDLMKDRTHFSLGHSEADHDTALRAIEAGADHATHLFNAMPPLGHRAPGLAGAVLDKGLYTEMICDGFHVHPAVIRMVFGLNADKTVLISDSIAPAGLENGVYSSGGQQVTAEDGKILTSDGTIAGSGIGLFEGLKRCVLSFGIDENEAVRAATENAAASVGLADTAGVISPGRNADMVMIDDKYNIIKVIKNGIML